MQHNLSALKTLLESAALRDFAAHVESSLSRGRPWYWKVTIGCAVYSYLISRILAVG